MQIKKETDQTDNSGLRIDSFRYLFLRDLIMRYTCFPFSCFMIKKVA